MEDEKLIGVSIKGCHFFNPNKFIFSPVITIYLVDKETGECISKVICTDVNDIVFSSYFSIGKNLIYTRENAKYEKGPFLLDEKIAIFNSQEKILMFEISHGPCEKDKNEKEKTRLAWAFLFPISSDGSKNIDKDVKLQLYEVTTKKCTIPHQTCNIYHLYKDHSLKKFLGALIVNVKGILRQMNEEHPAVSTNNTEEVKKPGLDEIKEVQIIKKILPWSRLPSQSCKIPNNVHKVLNLGNAGSSCVQFNSSGTQLAVSAANRILIYDVITGLEVNSLTGHNGFIYDLDWSQDSSYLLSASNDCTCIVWDLTDPRKTCVLPHPSFVYCCKWTNSSKELITGCRDHLLRYWTNTGEGFELMEEISGHSAYITSISILDEKTVISGDSRGCLTVHALRGNKWKTIKELKLKETSGGSIDIIHKCNSSNRVIVTSRSKGSFMIDLKVGIVTQKYKGVFNVILRSVSCLSPCGSLFFAFCQNGEVGVWNAHTAKHVASYQTLFPVQGLSEICGFVHYSPNEHMMAVGALDHNYPVLILKYGEHNDLKRLGLVFSTGEEEFCYRKDDFRYMKELIKKKQQIQ